METESILDKKFIKSKAELYKNLVHLAEGLLRGETDPVANMANFCSFLYHNLDHLNWTGFYILHGNELVLGPFQGKPACIRIPLGRGVCGTAAVEHRTIIVPDVHQFPGHIACDSASRSEIVIPVMAEDRLFGVLDMDSPLLNRFDEEDHQGLLVLLGILIHETRWF